MYAFGFHRSKIANLRSSLKCDGQPDQTSSPADGADWKRVLVLSLNHLVGQVEHALRNGEDERVALGTFSQSFFLLRRLRPAADHARRVRSNAAERSRRSISRAT